MTRWTEADVAAIRARQANPQWSVGQAKKAHKYHAHGRTVDGIHFPSKLESRLYEALKLRQQAGELRYFLRQVPFALDGGVIYRADFVAFPHDGREEIWDAKGYDTPLSNTKRRQVEARYGVTILLWVGAKRTA